MRILTLNTWHNNGPWLQRRDALIQGIVRYAPDILLFQELFDAGWSKELQARLGYPHLVLTECAHSGLVVLSKLPPHGDQLYRMNTKSPFENYWRYALWAELSDRVHRVKIFNTHLSWELEDCATREAQVRELLSFIGNHLKRSEDAFTIVAGDFNSTPDSAAMTWFLGSQRLSTLMERCIPEPRVLPGTAAIYLRKIMGRFCPTVVSTTSSLTLAWQKILNVVKSFLIHPTRSGCLHPITSVSWRNSTNSGAEFWVGEKRITAT